MNINISKIKIPDIPAIRNTDDTEFNALVNSIKDRGLIQPISVYEDPDNKGNYILIHGRRRLRACKELKYKKINAQVFNECGNINDNVFIENLIRKDLDVKEIIEFIKELSERKIYDESSKIYRKMTKDEIAQYIGRDNAYVTMCLSNINSSDKMKEVYTDRNVNDFTLIYNLNNYYNEALKNNKDTDFIDSLNSLDKINRKTVEELAIEYGFKEAKNNSNHKNKPTINSAANNKNNVKIIFEVDGKREVIYEEHCNNKDEINKLKTKISIAAMY